MPKRESPVIKAGLNRVNGRRVFHMGIESIIFVYKTN